MRTLVASLILTGLICCKETKDSSVKSETIVEATKNVSSFDWLLGDWQRTNEEPGKNTFEQWQKVSATLYTGIGYTMVSQDTVWMENIRLVKSEEAWIFEVKGKEDLAATTFVVTNIEPNSFSCENQQNEFPKVIQYTVTENGLEAIISGGEMQVLFEFEKRINQQ